MQSEQKSSKDVLPGWDANNFDSGIVLTQESPQKYIMVEGQDKPPKYMKTFKERQTWDSRILNRKKLKMNNELQQVQLGTRRNSDQFPMTTTTKSSLSACVDEDIRCALTRLKSPNAFQASTSGGRLSF